MREVIDTVQALSGRKIRTRKEPRRPGDLASVVANSDRLRTLLDWTPRFDDLETILAHALAWERDLEVRPAARLAS